MFTTTIILIGIVVYVYIFTAKVKYSIKKYHQGVSDI